MRDIFSAVSVLLYVLIQILFWLTALIIIPLHV
jgi:hypothetical protein